MYPPLLWGLLQIGQRTLLLAASGMLAERTQEPHRVINSWPRKPHIRENSPQDTGAALRPSRNTLEGLQLVAPTCWEHTVLSCFLPEVLRSQDENHRSYQWLSREGVEFSRVQTSAPPLNLGGRTDMYHR